MEIEDEHKLNTLEDEFADIVRTIGMEGSVIAERTTDTRQYKYRIENAGAYKSRLESLGAVMTPGGPVEQTDHYFLYPDEEPGLDTDTLCWREEKEFIDYDQASPDDPSEIGQLIIKTASHSNDQNPSRLVRYATVEDPDVQYRVLERINEIREGNFFAPYRVSKKRTSYLLPVAGREPVVIDIDEQVELSDHFTSYTPYPMGDFLKMKLPKDSPDLAKHLRELLGVTGDTFDIPYLAKEAFTQRIYTSRPNALQVAADGAELLWIKSAHRPYYYDARKNEYTLGLDPNKLKRLDAYEKNHIQQEIQAICAELDQSNGGQDLSSRASSGSGGSTTYEKLTGHDGFAKYPTIRASLESATLWRKRWQPSDKRIVFSRVTFKDKPDLAGIFVHYIGDHAGYKRWLEQHQRA